MALRFISNNFKKTRYDIDQRFWKKKKKKD